MFKASLHIKKYLLNLNIVFNTPIAPVTPPKLYLIQRELFYLFQVSPEHLK